MRRPALAEDFGPCPDCPGSLGITRDKAGNTTAIFHNLPACATFEASDPTAFLLRVLDIREASRRNPINEV